jgi:hypothetical protein
MGPVVMDLEGEIYHDIFHGLQWICCRLDFAICSVEMRYSHWSEAIKVGRFLATPRMF